ncbi:hypothetical protein CBR_g12517 [Chara braunii]|uniref:Uncharacterized protein n=1 Tax=Chara braunii TaxID=69332 RepID=A0A388JSI7_CHABU|nr:hypothetical protein CBR_g12517 [Chara braunii]|eukprot:GBG60779.1 hypothetical protein CBR_g12517 [Chara braunii]
MGVVGHLPFLEVRNHPVTWRGRRTVLPPSLASPSTAPRQTVATLVVNRSVNRLEEGGRQVWESYRRQMRQASVENITNGVSRMRVASEEKNVEDSLRASDYESPDVLCEEEVEDVEDMETRLVPMHGRERGGGMRQEKVVSHYGHRSKGPAGEKGGKHPPWGFGKMIKLARAKRNQQAHFEALGMQHNYERMRNREWKLQEPQKCLMEVGMNKTTGDIGKKWDNLFQ